MSAGEGILGALDTWKRAAETSGRTWQRVESRMAEIEAGLEPPASDLLIGKDTKVIS